MSSMYVKCKCGAEYESQGWGIRQFDLDWWVKLHAHCLGLTVVSDGDDKPEQEEVASV